MSADFSFFENLTMLFHTLKELKLPNQLLRLLKKILYAGIFLMSKPDEASEPEPALPLLQHVLECYQFVF